MPIKNVIMQNNKVIIASSQRIQILVSMRLSKSQEFFDSVRPWRNLSQRILIYLSASGQISGLIWIHFTSIIPLRKDLSLSLSATCAGTGAPRPELAASSHFSESDSVSHLPLPHMAHPSRF